MGMSVYHPADATNNLLGKMNEKLDKLVNQANNTNIPDLRGCMSFNAGELAKITGDFNKSLKENDLNPFVEWEGQTVNIYWNGIPATSSYTVSVYKVLWRCGILSLLKLKDFTVDRNECYLAITNLTGNGYIFVVSAESRDGKIISRSRGIDGCGSPKTW